MKSLLALQNLSVKEILPTTGIISNMLGKQYLQYLSMNEIRYESAAAGAKL